MLSLEEGTPELRPGDVVTVWTDPARELEGRGTAGQREGVAVLERFRHRPIGRPGLEVWRLRLCTHDGGNALEVTSRAVRPTDRVGHFPLAIDPAPAELRELAARSVPCPECSAAAGGPCRGVEYDFPEPGHPLEGMPGPNDDRWTDATPATGPALELAHSSRYARAGLR